MEKFHIILANAVDKLRKESSGEFTMLMKHGTMSIEYYAPKKIDRQTPHKQDEIYVIASAVQEHFSVMEKE